jgi:hypothetical protein
MLLITTGKRKTEGEIKGTTANSNGDIYRQLTFYKLLLDLEGKYIFKSAEVDFLQPDEKSGKYYKPQFKITDEEVEELKDVIRETIQSIQRLDFWDTTCDDPECKYCKTAERLKRR